MSSESAPKAQSPWLYPVKGLPVKLIWLGLFLWAAGRWDWPWPWLFSGIFVLFDIGTAIFVDPSLLVERASRHANTKRWDTFFVLFAAFLLPMGAGIVAGLDYRFGWGPEVSVTVQWLATAFAALGFAIVLWSMWANSYFSTVVRIQEDRGHQVATGGPYRIVRHPGYIGASMFTIALGLMCGSVWGMLIGVAAALLYVLRTAREDATLIEELPGYAQYAQQTRYRLLPGIW